MGAVRHNQIWMSRPVLEIAFGYTMGSHQLGPGASGCGNEVNWRLLRPSAVRRPVPPRGTKGRRPTAGKSAMAEQTLGCVLWR